MSFDTVKEMFDTLPLEKQSEVYNYVLLLYTENNKPTAQMKKNKFPFDIFRGGMNYIAEDFDETPEGFEDYI